MHSSGQTPFPGLATLDDLLTVPEESRFHEILDGELVPKEAASIRHGAAQQLVGGSLFGFRGKANGPSRPGGWWIVTEVTIKLAAHQIVRPDLAGWRRECLPTLPDVFPITLSPDWICEIGSDGDARRRDGLQKRRIYSEHNISHYWLLDLQAEHLTVLKLVDGVYRELLIVRRGERCRAEPFTAIELAVGALFGDED